MSLLARIKSGLKARQDSRQPFVRLGVGVSRWGWRSLLAVVSFMTNEDYRSERLLKLRYGDLVHQTTALTWMDRYPALFRACRERLGDHAELRLLSFGCSTGEEVLTLRRYFPAAQLVGADINPRALSRARQLQVDARIAFVHSKGRAMQRYGPFDAIFCMAVLQRTPHAVEAQQLPSLERLYPFWRFDAQLSALDGLLKPGGLLIVHHTQYVFEHASIAGRYRPLAGVPKVPDHGPRFDRSSRRIYGPVETSAIFVKMT